MKIWTEKYSTDQTDYRKSEKARCEICEERFVIKEYLVFLNCQPNPYFLNPANPEDSEVGPLCYFCGDLDDEGMCWNFTREAITQSRISNIKFNMFAYIKDLEDAIKEVGQYSPEIAAIFADLERKTRWDREDMEHSERIADGCKAALINGTIVSWRSFAPNPSPERRGYIYLVATPDGYCKIGRAKQVHSRITTINLQLPYRVELIHSFPASDMFTAESKLHKRFASSRMNGEWFYLTTEDIAWIKSLTSDGGL